MTDRIEASGPERLDDVRALLEIIGASWMSQAVCVAAELRIADLLAGEPRRIEALARAADCDPAALLRLVRALASLGLCVEHEDGTFALTATGELLRAEAHLSLRSWTIWWGRHLWPLWGGLGQSVRTGETARRLLGGHNRYEQVEADPEAAAMFDRGMVELTRLVAGSVIRTYDFADVRTLVDVGGGYGELLTSLLGAYPQMRGVLFGLPHAVRRAEARVAAAGLASRCALVAGSFFDAVPRGGDVYLLKSILHNWDDERGVSLLRSCHRAMAVDARLVLVERVMPARMTDSPDGRAAARADLNMLVNVGGRERTQRELATLLDSAGFAATKYLPTALGYTVIEALPAKDTAVRSIRTPMKSPSCRRGQELDRRAAPDRRG